MVDPTRYIITRKRKKYRFALFANAKNCFELEQWRAARETIFPEHQEIVVEVGAGTALFLVELAERYPERVFVALDIKADRLQKGAREADNRQLENIFFVRARADQLLEVVKPQSVTDLWLTFSDPFPRRRDAARRLTAPSFLELYEAALTPQGRLLQKTDSRALFDWSVEQFAVCGWHIEELSYDLHTSDLPDDYKVLTTYEEKWRCEQKQIYFVSVSR